MTISLPRKGDAGCFICITIVCLTTDVVLKSLLIQEIDYLKDEATGSITNTNHIKYFQYISWY